MANIKKSFNFVDGLQVDFDSFVVNNVGNVGVGTSSPSVYLFNVYGDSRVTGLTTTGALSVSGVSTFASDVKIGSAVTITSSTGIVSATSYYGDGSNLTGVFGIATQGWILVNGNTGLSTTLNVGIGTTQTNTEYDLIVGTGISFAGDSGNAVYAGIITSSKLDTTQIDTGNISVSGIATITDIDSGNLKSTGISTLGVTTVTNLTAQQLSVSGVSTLTGNVSFGSSAFFGDDDKLIFGNDNDFEIYHDGSGTGPADTANNTYFKDNNANGGTIFLTKHFIGRNAADTETTFDAIEDGGVRLFFDGSKKFETTNEGVLVSGGTTTGSLSVSGVSTFSDDILIGTGATVGFGSTAYFKDNAKIFFGDGNDLKISHNGSASNIQQVGTGPLQIRNEVADQDVVIQADNGSGSTTQYFRADGSTGNAILYHYGIQKLNTKSTGVNVTGTGSFDSIGIKTSAPSTDLQIRKASGNATLEVISDTGKSSISIGNSVGAGTSSASINYGSVAGFGEYSTNQSFNIINRDTGNVNYFLSNSAASDSGFRWHKLITPLMALSEDGNLGIGGGVSVVVSTLDP